MGLLRNTIVHYTVITFVVMLFSSVSLGVVLSRQVTDYLIQTHIDIFPHVIRSLADEHPEVISFLNAPPGSAVPESVKIFFDEILSFGAVFRIKVWGKDGTILWSDKAEVIGKNFKDNPHFIEAMQGKTNYSKAMPEKAENVTERGHGMVLEIYTPLKGAGSFEGVVELYESDSRLYEQISTNIRFVWLTVSGAVTSLYVLLFLVFYRSHAAQQKIARQLMQTQDVTILALAYQAELRDMETGNHIERTSHYVEILARELRKDSPYRAPLSEEYIKDLVRSAPLHDIGKVGVPDAVLCKPGRLDPGEFETVKRHCAYGVMILEKAEQRLTFQSFLKVALQLVMHHHEKWNGQGYPHGLKGDEIPLAARIMTLSDVYDALRSKRCYKEALSHEQAVEIIRKERGAHFDPVIVDAFLKRERDFLAVSEQFADTPEHRPDPLIKDAACNCPEDAQTTSAGLVTGKI